MQEVGLKDVLDRIAGAFQQKNLDVAEAYLWPALDQYPDVAALWFFAGNIWHQRGMLEPSALAFRRCLDLDYNPNVLTNLGATYRRLNKYEDGIRVLSQALRDMPDSVDALVNLGGMYVNEGNPLPGIPHLEKAIALEEAKGERPRAAWNLALLRLESGDFSGGFDLYRRGIHSERPARMYGYDGHEPVLYEPGMERKGKTLIVWGEQGIGDELMFGSVVNDARRDFGEVIFECHPRLEWLHQRSHKGIRTFPTRKLEYIDWPIKHSIKADYKLPVGDLAALYRPDRESFRKAWREFGPFYTVDPDEVKQYRARLEKLAGGRKIVGLAMRGGTFITAREHRSLAATEARQIIERTDAFFVGLDYEDMTNFAGWVNGELGNRYGYFPAITQSWDYQHHGALAAACDMVVTVCQSIAHLSAAMGLNVRVLTPKRVAWRYGLTGQEWFWYPHDKVKLYRQERPDSWAAPIERVIAELC